MKHTQTEENYLKTIFHFSNIGNESVSTNNIANELGTTPASVTDMIKKLHEKDLVNYIPYKGVTLTEQGEKVALHIIRKHRLWEVFLVQKLNFSWDNIHEVAEELEHIESAELIKRLDAFLGFPRYDPHGDPIPTEEGVILHRDTVCLTEVEAGAVVTLAGVQSTHAPFLQYLDKIKLGIGKKLIVREVLPFDNALQLDIDGKDIVVSGNIAEKLLVIKE
ncbi:MAG: metal-dependent transcriptional regulator [Bacteroidia bacterium]|nr:metal-dependent transcriptional regulator [Bacteroidia bacterium]